jgi:hypothetical protein
MVWQGHDISRAIQDFKTKRLQSQFAEKIGFGWRSAFSAAIKHLS